MTVQVNVSLDEADAASLDRMAQEDGFDNRSAFVRRLIRQEAARRQRTPDDGAHAPTAQLSFLPADPNRTNNYDPHRTDRNDWVPEAES